MFARRKKYFVKKRLQMKYLFFVLLAMVVPTIVCCGALYYFIWQTVASQIAVPEAIAENLIPALYEVNTVLAIAIPVVFIIIIFFAVVISHKIAGPVYRIERELKEISAERDYTRRIKLRTKDELQEITNAINELLEKLDTEK